MTGPVFVDTNVLVYRADASDPVRQSRADAWYRFLWRSRAGRLSFQILLELYSVLTRRLTPGFDESEAREIVRELTAWQPVLVDLTVVERAWILQKDQLLSWWDALVVAAAQTCECRVVSPFALPNRTPSEVLEGLEP